MDPAANNFPVKRVASQRATRDGPMQPSAWFILAVVSEGAQRLLNGSKPEAGNTTLPKFWTSLQLPSKLILVLISLAVPQLGDK